MSRARGLYWERQAERWLRRRDVQIIERNFTCKSGEIDLIARDGVEIAFIEVKFRARSNHGTGIEHVTLNKQRRIVSTARRFLQYHKHAPSQVFRFDVISISDTTDGTQFQWIKNAFEAVGLTLNFFLSKPDP